MIVWEETRVAFPTMGNEAGYPGTGSDELGTDRGKREVVGETVPLRIIGASATHLDR